MPKYKYELYIRGEKYYLTNQGWFVQTSYLTNPDPWNKPSRNWRVYGLSFHHWRRSPDLLWSEIKAKLDKGEGIPEGYLWDVDHGTTRLWGGSYFGKVPKAQIYRVR